MSKKSLDTLRVELTKQLERKELDFDSVLRLAGEIGRTDPNTVRFSTDATIISRLGRELVAKQETAVAELVKNAYDADATKVTLTFRDAYNPLGTLDISDNGHGMSRDDLVNAFMRLSTDEKIRNPTSPKYGRDRAGEKGIGRFAAERLGRRLILTTRRYQARKSLQVEIDWDRFTAGQDISSVGSIIKEIEPEFTKGTILVIEDLRDGWTDASIRQAWRYVGSLQSPFPLMRVKGIRTKDPGFKTWFSREAIELDERGSLADTKEFFKNAIAEVHVNIDKKGSANWSVRSRRYGRRERTLIGLNRDKPEPLPTARNVEARIYYYIRSTELYPWGIFGPLNEILRTQGGVRLYRNGYRVLPYGEPGDDWLNLDFEYRRRSTVLAPIGNNNWLGYVTVTDPAGILFQETSSREGLIENAAYKELTTVLSSALTSAAQHIWNARETERSHRRDRIIEKQREKHIQDTTALAKAQVDDLASTIRGEQEGKESRSQASADKLKHSIDHLSDGYEERLKALASQNSMLRILASMGLTIAEFTHEYGARAGAMKIDLNAVLKAVSLKGPAKKASDRLHEHFRDVEGFSEYFVTTLRQNINRTVHPIELFAFAEQFAEQMRPLFGDRITKLEIPEPDAAQVFTTAMHPSEWSSILMNFMTNSRKAIERSDAQAGKILIETGFLDDHTVYLTFADNGVGILDEYHDRIFEPFFTTTSAAPTRSSDGERLLGMGLGLKIVHDIVHQVHGRVEVVPAPEGYVTAIRASVPSATVEELEELYDN